MRHSDDDTSPTTSFLDYTREWEFKINRGGLFIVSDGACNFFVSLKAATRNKLSSHPQYPVHQKKAHCVICLQWWKRSVPLDFNIGLDSDMESEDMNQELLQHIAKLWITMRGFSLTKAWMEDCKVSIVATTQRKSLRQLLKQNS